MSESLVKTRIIQKHDSEANWKRAVNFVPKKGELIIYDSDNKFAYSRVKIGDGVTNVNDLPFSSQVDKLIIGEGEVTSIGIAGGTTDGTFIESYAASAGLSNIEAAALKLTLTKSKAKAPLSIALGANNTSSEAGAITLGYNNTSSGFSSTAIGAMNNVSGDSAFAYGYKNTINGDFGIAFGQENEVGYSALVSGIQNKATGKGSFTSGYNNTASGVYSAAIGDGNIAEGNDSFAVGYQTKALGALSAAEGKATTASGEAAHAEGVSTQANAYAAHAEGQLTIAQESNSHAEGYGAQATGPVSHAEGNNTLASGDRSHAEGEATTASGKVAHAEGVRTEASATAAHAEGYETVASAEKAHAEGYETIASKEGAHAEGHKTLASGTWSHAEGEGTEAIGGRSHAEGSYSNASGKVSHAEGSQTAASGLAAHAEGQFSKAQGDYSHAEGKNTTASGEATHSEGLDTVASGKWSHAEGYTTIASGRSSHAQGEKTEAAADYSHAEGYRSKTVVNTEMEYDGKYGHAEGRATIVGALSGHAEGSYTEVYGKYGHAGGVASYVDLGADCGFAHGDHVSVEKHAENSVAFGAYTKAAYRDQFVIGTFNEPKENALFIIGNGDSYTAKNAFEVTKDGTALLNGNTVATQTYVDKKIADAQVGEGDINLDAYYTKDETYSREEIDSRVTTVNNGILTIQKNGSTITTFSANQSGNATANITVPTKVSELSNDSGFITRDTNTTYDLAASKSSANGNVTINLTAGGSGSGTDSVAIKGTGATSVTTDSNGTITITSNHPTVSNNAPTLAWNTTATIGTIGGTALTVKMPENPDTNLVTSVAGKTGVVTLAKADVGLGNVVNTGDSATPTSGGTTKFTTGGAYTELAKKVDKISGKGLSTNDYTDAEKEKLAGIAAGAEVNVQSDWNATSGDAFIKNKPTIPTVNNATLTIQKNGTNVATFTANSATNATANITVPTTTNDLTNDSGFITTSALTGYAKTVDVDKKVDKISGKGLSTNDYTNEEKNKLAGIEAGAEVNVQSDWNATSGDAFIKNKPTIPTVNSGTLTIQKNGTTITTFGANQSSNATANIVVPTKVSELSNDTGFIATSEVTVGNSTLNWDQTTTIATIGDTNINVTLPAAEKYAANHLIEDSLNGTYTIKRSATGTAAPASIVLHTENCNADGAITLNAESVYIDNGESVEPIATLADTQLYRHKIKLYADVDGYTELYVEIYSKKPAEYKSKDLSEIFGGVILSGVSGFCTTSSGAVEFLNAGWIQLTGSGILVPFGTATYSTMNDAITFTNPKTLNVGDIIIIDKVIAL